VEEENGRKEVVEGLGRGRHAGKRNLRKGKKKMNMRSNLSSFSCI
jgi:hypothetical protein